MSKPKKMGRPKATVARKQFNVRLSDEERAKVESAATADRRTVSDWARLALLDAAERKAGR
jgi:uncharacterized protein (DUF1778 family)